MEHWRSKIPILLEEIRKRMFVFEDILTLDNRSIQRFLREGQQPARRSAEGCHGRSGRKSSTLTCRRVFAEMIREIYIEYMGPVRLKDVEEAQEKIVNIIRKPEDAGEIIISRAEEMK